jgi:hypothetical protein
VENKKETNEEREKEKNADLKKERIFLDLY